MTKDATAPVINDAHRADFAPVTATGRAVTMRARLGTMAARATKLASVWALAMLVALPSTGSRLEDATLGDAERAGQIWASLDDGSPLFRNTALTATAQMYGVRQGAVLRTEPVAVDLAALVSVARALQPKADPMPAAPLDVSLSTSGAGVAPVSIILPYAPEASLLPKPRPKGMERRVVYYSEKWVRSVAARPLSEQEQCLATAIYHEARGEGIKGQFAVAEVVLNRLGSRKFPGSICNVVYQGVRSGVYGGCQFSFACDRKSDTMSNRRAADIARRIAQVMADGGHRGLTDGALYFHTTAVSPRWAQRFTQTTRIGAHVFYRG